MSKLGRKNIILPKDSSIKVEGPSLTITGPKGSKKLSINDKIFSSKVSENEFQILPIQKSIDKKTSIMWGTYRSLINNAVKGVTLGHEKILELSGVGFRANLKGQTLNLQIGFSHEVNFDIPKEIKIVVEKQTMIKISGVDLPCLIFTSTTDSDIFKIDVVGTDVDNGNLKKGFNFFVEEFKTK